MIYDFSHSLKLEQKSVGDWEITCEKLPKIRTNHPCLQRGRGDWF